MQVTWMRRLLKKQPLVGVPVVGIFLLGRFLWLHKKTALSGLAIIVAVFGVLSVLVPHRKPAYSVTDLGTMANLSESVATDINNKGQVVGWCGIQGHVTHAFLWQNGKMTDLGTPRGSRSKALALNDKAQIVGWSGDDEIKDYHAFLWKNGKALALGTLPDHTLSTATGINKQGDVSGTASTIKGGVPTGDNAFLLTNGKMIRLFDGLKVNEAFAVNDKTQVVGYIQQFVDIYDGFLYEHGEVRELEGVWGLETFAQSINNYGVVVGTSEISHKPDDYCVHACLWKSGAHRAIDLGTLGDTSSASDINDRNQVVGWSYLVPGRQADQRAFLWQKGKMENLQDCIPADSGWTLSSASAINNRGQIVGTGIIDSKIHAFLLTPQ